MASEIRVDKINSLSGVGTVTLSPTGVDISGITTVQTLKVGTGLTASEDGDVFFTGVCTATTFAGSGANLTALPAANLSGTLPAISAANLTNVPAANITGTLPAISGANLTSLTAGNLSGALPAISAASLTSVPAANIVGVCTSGLTKTGGFGSRTIGTSYGLDAPDKANIDWTGFGVITRFEIHFNAVSTHGASEFGLRLGTGGSVDTSGYLCQSAYVRSSDHSAEHQTSGFFTHGLASASYSSNGVLRCWRVDNTQHKWYILADIYEYSSDNHWYYMKGYRTLSGELDIIRALPESGNFDGGRLRLVTYTD